MQLTTVQAADVLGVTRRRVLALIAAGRLRTERFGNAHLIDDKDLRALSVRIAGRPTKRVLALRRLAERPGTEEEGDVAREMLKRHARGARKQ